MQFSQINMHALQSVVALWQWTLPFALRVPLGDNDFTHER